MKLAPDALQRWSTEELHTLRPPAEGTERSGNLQDRAAGRVRVLFVYGRTRKEKSELCKSGLGPTEGFYGLPHLDPSGFSTSMIADDDSTHSLLRSLLLPPERFIAQRVGIGFSLHLCLEHRQVLRQADCIVTTVDACGLPIAMLKALGFLRPPLLYFSQGLSDRFENRPSCSLLFLFAHRLFRRFLNAADRIITLGQGAKDHLATTFGLAPELVHCIPFGIDHRFWTRSEHDSAGDYILSVGSDPSRDYETLIQAIDDEPLKIVTRLSVPTGSIKKNIEVGTLFTDLEVRDLYHGARFVVTPLKDVTQPSGQTATLQAMACGKAVIISGNRGLWEPDHMKHNENCYIVEPGNVRALRAAISHLRRNPQEAARIGRNARRTVEDRYSSRSFGITLQQHILEVLRNTSDVSG